MLDDFDRADENPLSQGGNWENFAAIPCRVVSNECASAAGNGIAAYVGLNLGTVQECWCEFGSFVLAVNQSIYATARVTINGAANTWSGYAMIWAYNGITEQIQLRRIVNNVETVLAFQDPFSMTAGDRIAVRTDESRIEGWTYNGGVWTLRLTATDATITSGEVGLSISGGATRVSSFGGGVPFLPQIVRTY